MGKSHSKRAELSMNGRCHGTESYKEAKWAVCRRSDCMSMREQWRREGTMEQDLRREENQ